MSASGTALYPFFGPFSPLYSQRNPLSYAILSKHTMVSAQVLCEPVSAVRIVRALLIATYDLQDGWKVKRIRIQSLIAPLS